MALLNRHCRHHMSYMYMLAVNSHAVKYKYVCVDVVAYHNSLSYSEGTCM